MRAFLKMLNFVQFECNLFLEIPYSVKIWTGEGEDNGTDANVWIVIYGTKKLHTGTQYLEFAQTGDKFEPGSVKTFSFDAPDVNEVKRIKVKFSSK